MIERPELAETEFRLLRDYIHERFGILFKDDKLGFVRMKLQPRVLAAGMAGFGEYLQWLKYGPEAESEQRKAISLLTNNETYFFRELPQLNAFRDLLLPRVRDQKVRQDRRRLRILSAGCSTGEEAYTLAMIVFETGSFFWNWDLRVIGMDIDDQALAQARGGVYPARSFRMAAPEYQNRFFSPNGAGYHVRPNLRQLVDFVPGNIADPSTWPEFGELDFIFCRNVLIYFSEAKVSAAIAAFHSALRPGGCLLLGHSETLTGVVHDFEPLRLPETIVYRRRAEKVEPAPMP